MNLVNSGELILFFRRYDSNSLILCDGRYTNSSAALTWNHDALLCPPPEPVMALYVIQTENYMGPTKTCRQRVNVTNHNGFPLLPICWTGKFIYNMENQVRVARLTDAPADSENGNLADCMCSGCATLA